MAWGCRATAMVASPSASVKGMRTTWVVARAHVAVRRCASRHQPRVARHQYDTWSLRLCVALSFAVMGAAGRSATFVAHQHRAPRSPTVTASRRSPWTEPHASSWQRARGGAYGRRRRNHDGSGARSGSGWGGGGDRAEPDSSHPSDLPAMATVSRVGEQAAPLAKPLVGRARA
jgi:hypothetical protein